MHFPLDLPAVPAAHSWRGLLAAPLAPATWRAYSFGAVGLIVTTVLFTVSVAVVSVSAALSLLAIGLPMLAGSLWLVTQFGRLERARLHATLGVTVPPPTVRAAPADASFVTRVRNVVTDRRRWTQVAYVVAAFGLMLAFVITLAAEAAGIAAFAYPLYRHVGDLRLPLIAVAAISLGGFVVIFLAPLLAQYLARWQALAAHALLGPDSEREAQREAGRRIAELTESRLGVVDAADAERRRIERDLHDGAQQRLVALGVELGMAKRETHDAEAAAVIGHAHAEVKEALAELRDLVRGVHPAILKDRGFDAALSALAARCPVPVAVEVSGPEQLEKLPDQIKAAAYFVTAEALTNVAKHSLATSARLEAERLAGDAPALWLVVADDGVGGAQATPGSGLAGLRGRIEALDGELRIESAPGSGTRLEAIIPVGEAR